MSISCLDSINSYFVSIRHCAMGAENTRRGVFEKVGNISGSFQ